MFSNQFHMRRRQKHGIVMILYLWAMFLKLSLTSHITTTVYRLRKSSASTSPKVIHCAMKFSELHYVAARALDDGSGCEALPVTWLQNRVYDNGYNYLWKAEVIRTISPPLRVYHNYTKLGIPGLLDDQSTIEVWLIVPTTYQIVELSLKDAAGVNSALRVVNLGRHSPPYTRISNAINDWEWAPINVTFPFVNPSGEHTLKFHFADQGMIYAHVWNETWFDFNTTKRFSPLTARELWINTGYLNNELYLEQFVFQASAA